MTFRWDNTATAKFRELWSEGYSARECAGILGGGLTRNAIIGKAHRLGLPPHPKSSISPRRVIMPVQELSPSKLASPPKLQPFSLRLTDLKPGDCRWPTGDGPFWFCGAPQVPGSAYCEKHRRQSINRTAQHVSVWRHG